GLRIEIKCLQSHIIEEGGGEIKSLKSATAWIMDFHMVSDDSMDHRYPSISSVVNTKLGNQLGLQWQYRPWTATWPLAAAMTKDIHMAFSGNKDYRRQDGLLQENGPQTST
ncbi:hypothetical protein STEG23_015713, partial [Scotinomys teguina]